MGAGRVALVAFLLLLAGGLGAGASYYFIGGRPAAAVTNTITSVSTSTATLTGGSSGAGASAISIDAVQIYKHSNASVVTVDGYVKQTVNSLFGPVTQLGEVLGSGFVMTYNGNNYVVTNFHVIDGATNMTVIFWNGDAYPASVVGKDPYSDLAIVKAPSAPAWEFHPLNLSSSSSVQVGAPVAAIGNPFGLSGSLTVGVVSQLHRTITEATAGNYSIADIIQFSAPINPGNSGGPLFNTEGQVIGLTTAEVNGSQGVGFAIPSDTVTREIGPLITTGSYDLHPYLGVGTADLNYQVGQANGNNVTYGVLVETVASGGPAAKAGIHAGTKQATIQGTDYLLGGDVIVSVNGTRIVNHDALASYLEENAVPGHTLEVGVIRGLTHMSIALTVVSRP